MTGYRIVFASDATAALSDAEHNATLLTMTTMFGRVFDTENILALIEG